MEFEDQKRKSLLLLGVGNEAPWSLRFPGKHLEFGWPHFVVVLGSGVVKHVARFTRACRGDLVGEDACIAPLHPCPE